MSTIRLRDFRPEDSPVLARLYHDTIHTVSRRDYTPEQVAAWAPAVAPPERWIERARTRQVVVAEDDSGVLGFGELRPADNHLDCLFVRHDAQGRGVASALVREVEARARALGIATLHVDVSLTARPLFDRRGYRVISPQQVEIRGVKLTNFRMEKSLEPTAG